VTITSRAPVQHAYSSLLPTPNEGVGLYERDLWSVGDRGERIVTFTRTTGPREAMTFALQWTGDDDSTFSSPGSVTLPLNQAVPLPIEIAPQTVGAHTALLTLDHPDVPGHAYRMLATIVVPEAMTEADSFKVVTKAEVPRPGMTSFFYRVPDGLSAIKFAVTTKERGVDMAVIRPDTRSDRGVGAQPSGTVVVTDPMPGTWEVRLSDIADTRSFDWEQAKLPEPVPPTPATLTVQAFSADVALRPADPQSSDGERVGTYQIEMANHMAAFLGSAVGTPMGSARRERPTIREGEQLEYAVDVPAGSRYLMVRAAGVTDPDADLDVYVFDCTGDRCRNPDSDADPVGDESVLVEDPAAGTWKIVVDAFSVPSGSTTFEYLDVVFNPSYGMLAVTDLPENRPEGATWTAAAHGWITEAASESGRSPFPAALIEAQPKGGRPFPVALRELVEIRSIETSSGRQ
jgi:hypothetical protein